MFYLVLRSQGLVLEVERLEESHEKYQSSRKHGTETKMGKQRNL